MPISGDLRTQPQSLSLRRAIPGPFQVVGAAFNELRCRGLFEPDNSRLMRGQGIAIFRTDFVPSFALLLDEHAHSRPTSLRWPVHPAHKTATKLHVYCDRNSIGERGQFQAHHEGVFRRFFWSWLHCVVRNHGFRVSRRNFLCCRRRSASALPKNGRRSSWPVRNGNSGRMIAAASWKDATRAATGRRFV